MYVKDCGALPRTPQGTVFASLRSVLNECTLGIHSMSHLQSLWLDSKP